MTGEPRARRDVDAVLILDKPGGMSSNRALQRVRYLYAARKAGHCGSLDPLATGVLPICFGEATKFSQYLTDADKSYRAHCRLGVTTTTGDAEGEVLQRRPVSVDRSEVESALARFVGVIEQVPPMYSALKHEGKRLYQLAREGREVERKARSVTIHDIVLETFDSDELVIRVDCSKGTYIRTLAEDIGELLRCGAHIAALRRLSVGHFSLEDAVSLDQLESQSEAGSLTDGDPFLMPVASALDQLPQLALAAAESLDIGHGRALPADASRSPGLYRLFDPKGRFIGLGEVLEDTRLLPKRLMNTAR